MSPTPSESPSEAASESAPAAEWADHGYVHKALGEVAGMTDANGASILSLTVDSITPSATCPEPTAEPSANGMYVAVQITATTSPGWGTDEFGEFRVTQYDFKAFQGNTLVPDPTNGGNAAWCGGDALAPSLGTNQSATWTVYIDVPTDTTSIAIVPGGLGGGGWEWLIP